MGEYEICRGLREPWKGPTTQRKKKEIAQARIGGTLPAGTIQLIGSLS
jgi:hypothetical protein